ncbi:TPA: hypothetical protein JLH71_000005 [Escherichia coli]|nr:hypothetical protein [Escherichia coli]EFB3763355.1 hypothetical protein [Escherichia coli]EFN9551491.1 hypothetical protein [Escherichia coli]MDC6952452.1 hypothetical protein [Escherichia coli]MDC6961451.1 hypothetical protein [Escherichia coli]MDN1383741.1 hypothetical protein [Escherichia coli]
MSSGAKVISAFIRETVAGTIDMPAGHGHMTLEFSVSAWLVNDWYPTASISDLLVVVMKKATAGISIS